MPVTARHLELRIPPVLVTLVFALLIWLVSLWLPGMPVPERLKMVVIVMLVSFGAFFSLAGVVSFRSAKTTVSPFTPGAGSALVTSGIYRVSRNPMYLGFLFFLVAWVFFLSTLYGFVLCLVFVLFMNRFQIQPEERALQSLFGTTYSHYKAKVRRWL